jgi:hypothetical protein
MFGLTLLLTVSINSEIVNILAKIFLGSTIYILLLWFFGVEEIKSGYYFIKARLIL